MYWERNSNNCKALKVGQYQLNAIIGKGTSAVVRLATHLPTGTKVAIKMVEKSHLSGNCLQQILQEIGILKKLDHPHIIKLYQVMQTTKLIYLVTEYAGGGEIFDHIVAYGKMNEREARMKFKQIVAGMVHCHQLDIVHRDLKAENVLLDQNLNVKIADFGFSAICKAGEKLNLCCGSPPYAAPELFEDAQYDGGMVDIWSLGIMLYVMTVGQLPFVGCSVEELKENIKKGIYKIPFFMSNECEELIKRLLCHDAKKRIRLMELVEHEWMTMGGEDEDFDVLINKSLKPSSFSSPTTFNQQILAIMQKMSYSTESVLMSLRERKFDNNWATYHILLDKLDCSSTDINNDLLTIPSPLKPKKKNIENEGTQQDIPQILITDSGFETISIQYNNNNNNNADFPAPEAFKRYLAMRRSTIEHSITNEAFKKISISDVAPRKSQESGLTKSFKISSFLKKIKWGDVKSKSKESHIVNIQVVTSQEANGKAVNIFEELPSEVNRTRENGTAFKISLMEKETVPKKLEHRRKSCPRLLFDQHHIQSLLENKETNFTSF